MGRALIMWDLLELGPNLSGGRGGYQGEYGMQSAHIGFRKYGHVHCFSAVVNFFQDSLSHSLTAIGNERSWVGNISSVRFGRVDQVCSRKVQVKLVVLLRHTLRGIRWTRELSSLRRTSRRDGQRN